MKLSRRLRRGLIVTCVAVSVFMTSWAGAYLPSVKIDRINGSEPRGEVEVSGSSMQIEGSAKLPGPPFVVDAGDSVIVRRGEKVTLTGFASGGSGTYEYEWSVPGGTFANAIGGSVDLETAGMSPGIQEVRLTLTDTGENRSVSDTVLIYVGPSEVVMVDEQRETDIGLPDEPPFSGFVNTGGIVDGQSERFKFSLPAGTRTLDAVLDWGDAHNDYDMDLHGPSEGEDSGATSEKPERIRVDNPAAGDYTVQVNPYLTTPDAYRLRVSATSPPPDPRPAIRTDGPFRFEAGAPQTLTASVSGGTEPHRIVWDLDMDGVFETSGATVQSHLPLGSHLVTAKVIDATGFERREVTAVRVVVPGQRRGSSPFVVIAVNDTGINPYHDEFSADTYPDARVLAATNNFTRHPSEYLPGYPKDAQALPISLDKPLATCAAPAPPGCRRGGVPEEDKAVWASVQNHKLYWIPGTKIVGALDHEDEGTADRRALDDDGHGTASAGVAVGNVYGHCPMCLLVSEETLDGTFAYDKPWIDFVTNSWGARARAGSAGLLGEDPPTAPKTSVERGQIALFSAGNGNEGAFVSPNQTYGTGTSGPDWAVRVGAAERYSRKPIIGDGNPAEVSSFGDGYNPTADHLTTDGVANHSGTSSATPYTAGAFGIVLAQVRERLGDMRSGQRAGATVAVGRPVPGSPYLGDGRLTRDELWDSLFKTAEPDTSTRHSAVSATAPHTPFHHLLQGYGIVDSQSAARALQVLLGRTPMPQRGDVDMVLSADSDFRRRTWGEWAGWKPAQASRRPDKPPAFAAPAPDEPPPAAISSPSNGALVDASRTSLLPVTGYAGSWEDRVAGSETQRMWLRQAACGTASDSARLSVEDGPDGGHGCSSLIEPASMAGGLLYFADEDAFPATDGIPVVLDRSRPVTGTIWIRGRSASLSHEITVELVSDKGIIGRQLLAQPRIGDAPTAFRFSFPVPKDIAGRDLRKLTLNIRSDRSLGLTYPSLEPGSAGTATQDWRSFVDLPLAGPLAEPAEVALAVNDKRVLVTPVETDGTWGDNISLRKLSPGKYTIAAQPLRGGELAGPRTEIEVDVVRSVPAPVVQVQLVRRGTAPKSDQWLAATDTSADGDWSMWSSSTFALGSVRSGRYDLYSRLMVNGVEVAISGPTRILRPEDEN